MGDWMTFLVIVLAALGVGGSIYRMTTRSQQMMRDWAVKNHLELEEAELRMFGKGPFWWSSKWQVVYRVAARDTQGRLRRGWVQCGDWLLGMMGDRVEVRWDD